MAECLDADAPQTVALPTLPVFQNRLVFGISPATSHGFLDGNRGGGMEEPHGPTLGSLGVFNTTVPKNEPSSH